MASSWLSFLISNRNLATLFQMKQFCLGIEIARDLTVLEESLLESFLAGMASGDTVGIVRESGGRRDLVLRLAANEAGETEETVRMERTATGLQLEFDRGTLPLALEEFRLQFQRFLTVRSKTVWDPFHFHARMPTRGVRIGPDLWGSEDFREYLETLLRVGITTVAMDIVRLPITIDTVEEETQAGPWLERISPKIEIVRQFELGVLLNFPIQLDLHPSTGIAESETDRVFCRQQPSGRRQIIHRFENLIRTLPTIDGVGFIVSDWGRCRCPLCQATSFEEETAYYLRAFAAVVNRYGPDLSLWAFPDEISRPGLEEIRSQIPPGVRIVTAAESETCFPEEVESGIAGGEGEVYVLHPPLETDVYRHDRVSAFLGRWENLNPPNSFFGDLHACSTVPVNTLALLDLFWEIRFQRENRQAWLYRRMLPPEESDSWEFWHQMNDRLLDCATRFAEGTERSSFPFIPVETSTLKDPSGFDLVRSLKCVADRIRLDRTLIAIETQVHALPSGERIRGNLASTLQGVVGLIYEVLSLHPNEAITVSERRSLENLRDHIYILLSENRPHQTWNPEEVPCLEALRVHRLIRDRKTSTRS